jgi:hypothetical protein
MRSGRSLTVAIVAAGAIAVGGALAAAQDHAGTTADLRADEELLYARLGLDPSEVRERQFLASLMMGPVAAPRDRRRTLDLTPLAEWAIAYVRGVGVPLVEHRDERGKRPIAVSAEFAVADDRPNVKLHLGDRPAEPLGAFYPPEKGFRFSVVYPMNKISLRIEGGDDSEFGSLAVAGLSWVHPSQRFAAGFGLPAKLKNTRSDFGVIFQFRMNLP